MIRYYIIFLFLLFTSTASAQLVNIKTRVYFGTDSSLVKDKYKNRLSKFSDSAKKLTIKGILLRGNTDGDADSLYNIRLSKRRVIEVKKILVLAGINDTLIHFDYYGENKPIADNESAKGKQKNRRVDVILSATIPVVAITSKEEKDTIVIEELKDTCLGDTTFTLPEGTIIIMNKCEVLKQKECGLPILTEYMNPKTIRDSMLNTMDNGGNAMISGGMFRINTCDSNCFEYPLKIRVLILKGCEPPCVVGLYEQEQNWTPIEDSEVDIIKINGKRYYEITVSCQGLYNFDCRYNMQNLTIKLPRKYKLIETRVSNDCPMWNYQSDSTKIKKERKVKVCIICQKTKDLKENYVFVKALNKENDTVIMNYKKIKELKLRYKLFPGHRCRGVKQKKPCPNILYYFGRRKSKIKIRAKDFDLLIPSKPN